MAGLPNRERAILDLRKIEDYCLNSAHPRGRHKARVLRNALGLERNDARWLRDALLEGLAESDAAEFKSDALGRQWRVDVPITRQGRRAMVRTLWIVRTGEDFPRFVTCWVL
jgi:hypothetical protein